MRCLVTLAFALAFARALPFSLSFTFAFAHAFALASALAFCPSLRIESKFRFRSDRFACDLDPFWVNVECILGPFWGCQIGSNANSRRIGPQVASKAVLMRFLAGPCAKVI